MNSYSIDKNCDERIDENHQYREREMFCSTRNSEKRNELCWKIIYKRIIDAKKL